MNTNRFVVLLAFCLILKPANAGVAVPEKERFFIVDSWVSGFFYGFFSSKECRFGNAWHRANRTAANDVKIWGGLFISDPNRKFGGRLWEHVSRFTWEFPQTVTGLVYAHAENTFFGNADTVRYKYGAVSITGRRGLFFGLGGPAVTLGNYIIGDDNLSAKADNPIFQHEYGHYLQSRRMGLAYFGRIAIPSLRSEHGDYKENYQSHDYHPAEQDANRRAFLYFNSRLTGFQNDTLYSSNVFSENKGWDFRRNPFSGIGAEIILRNRTVRYVDYTNPEHLASLEKLRVKAQWYDYLFIGISGFYNSYRYNH